MENLNRHIVNSREGVLCSTSRSVLNNEPQIHLPLVLYNSASFPVLYIYRIKVLVTSMTNSREFCLHARAKAQRSFRLRPLNLAVTLGRYSRS